MPEFRIVLHLLLAACTSVSLLACGQGSADSDAEDSGVFFERLVELSPRETARYEFECNKSGTMRVEVKPDGTTYVSLETPGGSALLNEYKIKTGEELHKDFKDQKAGRYTLRLKNSNLVDPKRVSVKITSQQ